MYLTAAYQAAGFIGRRPPAGPAAARLAYRTHTTRRPAAQRGQLGQIGPLNTTATTFSNIFGVRCAVLHGVVGVVFDAVDVPVGGDHKGWERIDAK